jgi:hypothetical protein
MAYFKASKQLMRECKPTVQLVFSWFAREYKADVHFVCERHDYYLYEIRSDELPDNKVVIPTITEIVPGVVIINVAQQTYAD